MTSTLRRDAPALIVWAVLLTMPWWIWSVSGYTDVANRIVVLGLAAMSLNFLLDYTGVLSFGHALYFGLDAYGVEMALSE